MLLNSYAYELFYANIAQLKYFFKKVAADPRQNRPPKGKRAVISKL